MARSLGSVTAAPEIGGAGGRLGTVSPVRVVVADEHALMRRGLWRLLGDEGGLVVVGEARDLAAVMREVAVLRPAVLVIDPIMSDGSTIDLIRRVRQAAIGMEVVVLTMEDSTVFARAALDGGAVGFVVKQAAEEDLARAVRSAARGERFVSPRVNGRLELLGRRSFEG